MRLHAQLASMVALEGSIEARTRLLLDEGVGHAEVAAALERAHGSSAERRRALAGRLEAIAPGTPTPDAITAPQALESLSAAALEPASAGLVAVHSLLTQAVLGYALLLELSFRAADSIEHLGPENTGDLAWEHLRACTGLVRDVLRALPYVVVDELEQRGLECRCMCPTCGLGVCGCALAFRRRLDLASAEAGAIEVWPGLTLVAPRPGSPAARAGLAKGDVLETLDGEVIDSIPKLQAAISGRAPGEQLVVRMRRGASSPEDVHVKVP